MHSLPYTPLQLTQHPAALCLLLATSCLSLRCLCCYRHKVTTPGSEVDVSSIDDVQRLYILLQPQQPSGGKCRLLVVAKKRLPDTKRHERFYVFVGECSTG